MDTVAGRALGNVAPLQLSLPGWNAYLITIWPHVLTNATVDQFSMRTYFLLKTTNRTFGESMIRISYLMRRLPHLSQEEFQAYWSEKHPQAAPADAFSTLGVQRYVQVFPLEGEVRDLVIGPRTGLVEPFDGIAELWVESEEALERDWSTSKAREYVKIFFEDEQNFIDWTRSTILVSNENVVIS